MSTKKTLTLFFLLCSSHFLISQETFPRNDVKDDRPERYAFTNAIIVVSADQKLENATMIIEEGKVIQVGTNITIPDGYTTIDLAGNWIYPSLVDPYTTYGMPEVKRHRGSYYDVEQIESDTKGPYNANEAIKSEFNAFEAFTKDAKMAQKMRKLGFGSALVFRPDGLARGASALVTLGDQNENIEMIKDRVAAHYSFSNGSSSQMYPASAMGRISLLRQTYLDAAWFRDQPAKPFTDKSLDAWIALQELPQIFEATNWMTVLRADKIGDEFGVQYIIKGGGDAYKRINEIKKSGATLIVPINFPAAYDVEDPLDAHKVALSDMKHWELAPTNLAHLAKNNIPFVLTTHGLKELSDFWPNLRTAIKHGLPKSKALAALTTEPAKLLKASDQIGTLEAGKLANLIITSGDLFDSETVIYQNWVQGKPHELAQMDALDLSGVYTILAGDDDYKLEVSGKPTKPKASIILNDTTSIKAKLSISNGLVSLHFAPDKDEQSAISLSGWVNDGNLSGTGQLPDGSWISWQATREGDLVSNGDSKQKETTEDDELGPIIYPFLAYGEPQIPQQEKILFQNATVWTIESDEPMEGTDVLVNNGKIVAIGKNLPTAGAKVIDGTGKHLTPGIIDEHTHIAGGGNERLTNSAMVRIGDQVNSEDINIYRALSGGVTAVQVLHGSANPIGGQSALIKLRWGAAPEDLKIKGADGYIKFALGENVKRSRSSNSIRYPQTRMGVEQVFMDAFSEAKEYESTWRAYQVDKSSGKVAPRRDLALEALLEIINGERFITCHSYVQSEINMLMKVAEAFDFKVNTFTHIIEGFKVADIMAKHGAGASAFSDWWAYKWEVRYGTPYNPAIMAREGVVTAINSDDREMMRRLNQEAAKSVKYGNLPEIEALKMVTINPAKLLHLDKRMGSIKEGKDADLVLWSDHPLSIYAKAEKTVVDGTIFYDIEKDARLKAEVDQERARLVRKMIHAKANGSRTQSAESRVYHNMHCEDIVIYNGGY